MDKLIASLELSAYRLSQEEIRAIKIFLTPFQKQHFEVENTKLPEIYASKATPFKLLELKKKHQFDFHNRKIDIDKLLGEYICNDINESGKIVIYTEAIDWCTDRMHRKIDKAVFNKNLYIIVLLHELGHWCRHYLPTDRNQHGELHILCESIEEGLAQWFTYKTCKKIEKLKIHKYYNAKLIPVFERLNEYQQEVYHGYKVLIQNRNTDNQIYGMLLADKVCGGTDEYKNLKNINEFSIYIKNKNNWNSFIQGEAMGFF